MGAATIERRQRAHPRQWPRFFKRSSQHEIYELSGIGHLFARHLVS